MHRHALETAIRATAFVGALVLGQLATAGQVILDHDEWTLDDLETLGVKREEIWKRIPSPAVAALVGVQYYWMQHVHPVAYLSYQAVMERPPSPEFLEEAVTRTGLPREAFATQFFHATVDPHHIAEFDRLVDSLPLTEWHHSILGVNAFQSVELMTRVYQDLLARFEASHPDEVSVQASR